jgi:hypothetical protein
LLISELWHKPIPKQAQVAQMPSKDQDVFYLKLQWISSKDEAERKRISDKIRELLSKSRE